MSRFHTGRAFGLTVGLLLVVRLGAGTVCSAAAKPTNKPTPKSGAKAANSDDAWLAVWGEQRLAEAVATGQYEQVSAELEEAIRLLLAYGTLKELDTFRELVHLRRACRFLPMAAKTTAPTGGVVGDKLVAWLMAHPSLARLLYRALEDLKTPEEGLARLAELVSAAEAKVVDWPDLTVAFATATPAELPRPQPEAATLVESFLWYADPPSPLKYDLKGMPYELLRFLADTRLSIAERKWALATYRAGGPPTKAYFDIEYDMDHLMQGRPRKNESGPYSLPNLRRLGGVCFDQAYYASEVTKAVGVPATVVFGRGGSGVPHSWFAHFKIAKGSRAGWDAKTGRYQEHLYLMGLVRDPASGEKIADSVLSVLGHAMLTPSATREQAETAVELARLVRAGLPTPGQPGTVPEAARLRQIAEQYTARVAADAAKPDAAKPDGTKPDGTKPDGTKPSGSPNAPKSPPPPAELGWLTRVARRLDQRLAEQLLDRALTANLVCNRAWDLVVDMRREDQLPADRAGQFLNTLISKTAKDFPDYSYTLLMKIVPTLPDAATRMNVFVRARDIYAARADLQGRLQIAMADEHLANRNTAEAIKLYETAAARNIHLAEIVLRAAIKAEDAYRNSGRAAEAIPLYYRLFGAAKKDPLAGIFRNQTSHYQLGERLSALLEAENRTREAQSVKQQMAAPAN